MKAGLKIFAAFTGIFLEARVGEKAKPNFLREYGCRAAGEGAEGKNAFMVRTKNGWPGGVDAKTYFAAPDWVVDSLRALGFRVVERQIDMEKYEGGLREYKWKVCNLELFWWLVDYGYRIGKNAAIPFEVYLATQEVSQPKRKIAL